MSQRRPEPPFPPQDISPPGDESRMDPRPQYQAPGYRAAGKLDGQTALITGGDSGIGRAVAVLFAREGADVALVHLPDEQNDADETVRAVREAGRDAITIAGDVRDPEFAQQAVDACVERFGKLDVLVNNAAFQNHLPGLDALDLEQWRRTFDTNIHGYFHFVKAAYPHLKPGGRIIQTGSILGLEASGGLIDYSATKGAIHAFTKALAQNLADEGVRVNCVAPGPVWTPLNPAERDPEQVENFGAGSTEFGRPAQPEEVAPAYVFFASNADSGFISGEVITVLGGRTRAG